MFQVTAKGNDGLNNLEQHWNRKGGRELRDREPTGREGCVLSTLMGNQVRKELQAQRPGKQREH